MALCTFSNLSHFVGQIRYFILEYFLVKFHLPKVKKKSMPITVSRIELMKLLPPVLSACPLHINSGCGKERRILIGLW